MMAQAKGAYIPPDATFEEIEHLLDGWVYTGYVDVGAVSPDLLCECDRPLRYQHVVTRMELGLPLLDRQVFRLRRAIQDFNNSISNNHFKKYVGGLQPGDSPDMDAASKISFVDNQAEFDFFGSKAATATALSRPAYKAKAKYRQEGVSSVRVITELLIKHNDADDGKYSTGKPHMYGIHRWSEPTSLFRANFKEKSMMRRCSYGTE